MVACSTGGQGMGTYDFTSAADHWELALTADEYAGTYNSTVTTTLATMTLPVLYSFSPASQAVGGVVILTGTGFTGATAVSIHGTPVTTMTVDSNTEITLTVPSDATTGKIIVTTPTGTATSATDLTIG